MKHRSHKARAHSARLPLRLVPPGRRALLAQIGDDIEAMQREQLAAYGLLPGSALTVLQQQPMTVIFTDELELALEPLLARDIWVELLN